MIASLTTAADLAAKAEVPTAKAALTIATSGRRIFQLRNVVFICPPLYSHCLQLTTLNPSERPCRDCAPPFIRSLPQEQLSAPRPAPGAIRRRDHGGPP